MKCLTPLIHWHEKEALYCCDIHITSEHCYKIVTGGADKCIRIWEYKPKVSTFRQQNNNKVAEKEMSSELPTIVATLRRHTKTVNCVRFSSEKLLATAGDDGAIYIWKLGTFTARPDLFGEEDDKENKEHWQVDKCLRGHFEDIYDLSWSQDGSYLVSGALDNSIIVWDAKKGVKLSIHREAKNFVQGVAWDPLNQYVASMSTDNRLRIYSISSSNCIKSVSQVTRENKKVKIFLDDMGTYFRRLVFSPDGALLIAPAGKNFSTEQEYGSFIFTRACLDRPSAFISSGDKPSLAVRFCPQFFNLRNSQEPKIKLPYRMLFAVATNSSVIFHDTEQLEPFACITDIHYSPLTDLAWSADGLLVFVTSSDGFSSIISFEPGELGEPYHSEAEKSPKVIVEVPSKLPEPIIIHGTPEESNSSPCFKPSKRIIPVLIDDSTDSSNPSSRDTKKPRKIQFTTIEQF